MRTSDAAHLTQPWRIHALVPDFRLEDVWRLPVEGGPGDFPRVVEVLARKDPAGGGGSRAARALFALRFRLGALLGWDDEDDGLGARVPTLRDRLPADLRDAAAGAGFDAGPFTPLYLLDDEAASEIANRTMHGVLHLGWVSDGDGGFHAQMAVYVQPNGWLGEAYMLAIRPFRYGIVYPAMLREMQRAWAREQAGRPRQPAP